MKMILRADQNHCPDVAVLRQDNRIHTSIQQRQKISISANFFTLTADIIALSKGEPDRET